MPHLVLPILVLLEQTNVTLSVPRVELLLTRLRPSLSSGELVAVNNGQVPEFRITGDGSSEPPSSSKWWACFPCCGASSPPTRRTDRRVGPASTVAVARVPVTPRSAAAAAAAAATRSGMTTTPRGESSMRMSYGPGTMLGSSLGAPSAGAEEAAAAAAYAQQHVSPRRSSSIRFSSLRPVPEGATPPGLQAESRVLSRIGSSQNLISPRTLTNVRHGAGLGKLDEDAAWYQVRSPGGTNTPGSISRKSSFRGILGSGGVSPRRGIVSRASSMYLQYAASRTVDPSVARRLTSGSFSDDDTMSCVDEVSFPRGMARQYMFVFQDVDDRELDASRFKLEWGEFEDYAVNYDVMLGQGAYGEVYKATHKPTDSECVVKTIKVDKESVLKLKQEIMMLERVKGGPCIVEYMGLVRNPDDDTKLIVFEFVNNPNYKESFRDMTDLDARWYLFRVLKGLDYAHSLGVIHRDIKGGNICYDPITKKLRIIDWGFGVHYVPSRPFTSWPGTRPYKAPELFLHYSYYDYSVDVWAFACLMGSLIFRRTLFRSKDNRHQMELIARALGTASYERYLAKYARPPFKLVAKKYRHLGEPHMGRGGFQVYVSSKTPLANFEALDIINKVLVWDHEKRPTASELIQHAYFDPVRHRDAAAVHAAALQVASPGSGKYAKYWSTEKVVAALPSAMVAAEGIVSILAETHGIAARVAPDGASVVLESIPISLVEEIFSGMVVHACSPTKPLHADVIVAAALGTAHLAPALARHLAFATGVSDFPPPSVLERMAARAGPLSPPSPGPCKASQQQSNNLVIPSVVRELVGIPRGKRVASQLATQAAIEFGLVIPHETGQEGGGGGGFLFSDLAAFAELASVDAPHQFNVSRIIGPFAQHNYTGNAESVLDVTTLLGVAPGAPTTYATYLGWMYEFLTDTIGDPERALVHSISYGTPEYLQCNKTQNGEPFHVCAFLGVDARGYIERCDLEFARTALLGLTIVASSGDNGAPGELSRECELDNTIHPLHTVFPAASQYTTAVGGVVLVEAAPGPPPGAPQPPICTMAHPGPPLPGPPACGGPPYALTTSMCSNGGITTGGGFANYSVLPEWQAPTVRGYLDSSPRLPPATAFHANHRAFPDVALLASNILIILNGEAPVGAGTSASAPQMAALLTHVNGELLASGLPPVGWINPLLYTLPPSAFIDITTGSNECTEAACCKYGYGAASGFDAVTGRGVPLFEGLLAGLAAAHGTAL
ncbi:uncharacterized protein AMSG_11861 [Thecamonas trahens ATCC 50062]|uniref:Uncharacterized protein n=1 Tax=Thecamonas trahens ATCC 50062 TaxID=461836 RepID=A0A0L0DAU9_THETB|nr:hypothetical protein AMSG_11861 [Thecamonas trahens ATCC 50062]KNC49211.1 hypothetical protein AMSG_11861 [Thecamonas trahens ATCC 50062]|eukprot:XP_013758059.1 hypothetical protein AMSG_11861 [Thecamonas trahens ATCC 50062]